MKTLIALAALLPLAASAALPYPPPSNPTADNTAGIVLYEVNHVPQFVMFVSKTGQVAAEKVETCAQNVTCKALVNLFAKDHRISILDVVTGTDI